MANELTIANAQADFALNLLRAISSANGGQPESTIVSPISVSIALSMAFAGAKGETATEMSRMLAKEDLSETDSNKLHAYFGTLLQTLKNHANKEYTLEMADRVYVKSSFNILDSYIAIIDQHYCGQFESVNFEQNQATAKEINNFVAHATHDKIHDLISPRMLTADTRMVLINAIYFKGNWMEQFKPERTSKDTFFVSEDGQEALMDMMHQTHKFIYHEAEEFQLLGLPYVGEKVLMFVLLPKERFGLRQMLANLDGQKLLELVQFDEQEEVEVTLPKFKLECTHALNEPLKAMGIANAFSDCANFGGISAAEPLKIDQVVQKAFIEVNEEGSEAAAASGVVIANRCMAYPMQPKPKFVADHPFAFFIMAGMQQQQQQLLFNGIFCGTF